MKTFGKIVSLLMLPLIAEVIYGSLMSFFFKTPPVWGFETTMFIYGSFFMLGTGYCHLEKKHVAMDVINHYVGPKTVRVLSIFSEIVVLFVALIMLYFSSIAAYRSITIRERSSHQTPFNPEIWWYRCVIPISCALVSWQAFKDMLGLITGRGTAKDREKREGEHNAA